jgi:hypothetical protein
VLLHSNFHKQPSDNRPWKKNKRDKWIEQRDQNYIDKKEQELTTCQKRFLLAKRVISFVVGSVYEKECSDSRKALS